ncbi:MAG: plastocyanin/azurin family copper-binding protein [Candidatus Tumulicola sp.]
MSAGARAALAAVALAIAACTPNGIATSGSSGGGGGGMNHIVDVNLTLNQPVQTPYGQSGGMKPAVTNVKVGDTVTFMNSDGFAHTSTSITPAQSMNETKFPSAYPFSQKALNQTGSTLSGGWSSGAMQAGSGSQVVKADKPGTYLYGCFFHYGAPMRGAIVAQ